MIKSLATNLMVEDVTKAAQFYCDNLGFKLAIAVPADKQEVITELPIDGRKLVYAQIRLNNLEIMFQEKSSLAEDVPAEIFKNGQIGGSIVLYFGVDNFDEIYNRLKTQTAIVKDLHNTWYGIREFYVADPNGYILGFGEAK